VQAPFAPLLELEVLDSVRHVDALTVQACLDERFIQQNPCRSDKRSPFEVFSIPRLFANEHHVCAWRSFTENGLRGVFPSGHAWQDAALRRNASSLLPASLSALTLTA
jgi:hypothetical protein